MKRKTKRGNYDENKFDDGLKAAANRERERDLVVRRGCRAMCKSRPTFTVSAIYTSWLSLVRNVRYLKFAHTFLKFYIDILCDTSQLRGPFLSDWFGGGMWQLLNTRYNDDGASLTASQIKLSKNFDQETVADEWKGNHKIADETFHFPVSFFFFKSQGNYN